MKKRGILSVVMAVLVIISMLPSMVFAAAAPSGALDGKLKIKGLAAVGVTLSADYENAKPAGLTDDYVTFQWSRKNGEELTEVGTEKTYQVTEADVGLAIVLKITGKEDLGLSGSLTVTSKPVAATEEEAKAVLDENKETADAPAEATDTQEEAVEEPLPAEESGIDEMSAEDTVIDEMPAEELPAEDTQMEEFPGEDTVTEEIPSDDSQPDVQVEEVPFEEPTDDGTAADDGATAEDPAADGETVPDELPAQEPLTYSAEAAAGNEAGVLDFGTVSEGESDSAEAQYATITNTGTGELNFISMSPEHFMVADIGTLGAGESFDVWVQPREGIAPGTYNDTITYETEEGATASFQATVTVAALEVENPDAENPDVENPDETPVSYAITADAENVAFEGLTEGYGADALTAQQITIMNAGDSAVTLADPAAQYFDVVRQAESNILESGAFVVYNITPKAGLAAQETPYQEAIVFGISEDASEVVSVNADVTVTAPEEPKVSVSLDRTEVAFEPVEVGYTELPGAVDITITNNGEAAVSLAQPEGSAFTASLSAADIEVGDQAVLSVQPVSGLEEGEYTEQLLLYEAGEGGELLATVTAVFTVTEKTVEPDYSYSAAPGSISFGSLEQGYKVPDAQTVTLTNTGNQTLVLTDIKTGTKAYKMGGLSAKTVEAGGTITFKVRPQEGLEAGNYEDKITIVNEAGVTKEISLSFTVTKPVIKVTSIHRANEITGLTNGIKKTADSFGLPSTVVIETTKGKMEAAVAWNVEECAYSQESVDAQTFEVKGTVTLPEGVTNPDNLELVTAAKVSVKAYVPKVPDKSATTVTGISSDGDYTTDSKITITATGGGMDNANPRKGDIRYVPASWKVLESRNWDGAPYTATFRMNKGGDYTLTVAFNEQKYDGSQWVKTNQQATRQVSFKVKQLNNVTATPTPTAQQRRAVQTGDNTAILPMVIILAAAVVCIAVILVYRKKKK